MKTVARFCKEEGKQERLLAAPCAGGPLSPRASPYCHLRSHHLLKGAKGKHVSGGTTGGTGGNEEQAAELHVKLETEIQEGSMQQLQRVHLKNSTTFKAFFT